jgi:hypothetical protein
LGDLRLEDLAGERTERSFLESEIEKEPNTDDVCGVENVENKETRP